MQTKLVLVLVITMLFIPLVPSGAYAQELQGTMVTALDFDGNLLYMSVTMTDKYGTTGFTTPKQITTTNSEPITLTVYDYKNWVFDHWGDGNKERTRTWTGTEDTGAHYNNTAATHATFYVIATDQAGNSLNMWTQIDEFPTSTASAVTTFDYAPLRKEVPLGQTTTVTVHDYDKWVFDHWYADGSTNRTKTYVVGQAGQPFMLAVYRDTPLATTNKLTVQSKLTTGEPINGKYVDIYRQRTLEECMGLASCPPMLIKNGFTPMTYDMQSQYIYGVKVHSYGKYIFDHWEEDTRMYIYPTAPKTVTAIYKVTE